MKKTAIAFAAAATLAAGLVAGPANANLVQLTDSQLKGQGIGAVTTVLTLQKGKETTESGGVNFDGSVYGDAKTGASQSTTFTFASLGITDANQLGLVVNLSEPGSENPPMVTAIGAAKIEASRITLNVYSSMGSLLESHTLAADTDLFQVAGGVGGSGIVFGLDAAETTQLNKTVADNAGAEVFTVGATFANAQGGNDVIQAVRLTSPVAAIPEPETYALMLAGLGALSFVAKRRKAA